MKIQEHEYYFPTKLYRLGDAQRDYLLRATKELEGDNDDPISKALQESTTMYGELEKYLTVNNLFAISMERDRRPRNDGYRVNITRNLHLLGDEWDASLEIAIDKAITAAEE
jgi:hypothetical protein